MKRIVVLFFLAFFVVSVSSTEAATCLLGTWDERDVRGAGTHVRFLRECVDGYVFLLAFPIGKNETSVVMTQVFEAVTWKNSAYQPAQCSCPQKSK